MAIIARLGDYLTGSIAPWTGRAHLKKPLGTEDLPTPLAGRADLGFMPRAGTGSLTGPAGFFFAQIYLPADALHRLLKGMSDAIATANWRASTLYEAGWRHLSEAATEVQP